MNRFAIIFGVLTFVSTLAGGLFAVRCRKRLRRVAAFAAGVLIAVSVLARIAGSGEIISLYDDTVNYIGVSFKKVR